MNVLRQILSWLALSLWFFAIVLWPGRGNEAEELPKNSSGSREGLYKSPLTEASFGLMGADFYETSEGRKQWNIRSEFAELQRAESYCFMKVVNADFFAAETGNVIFTKSDFGRSWFETRKVDLEGNVEVQSKRGKYPRPIRARR